MLDAEGDTQRLILLASNYATFEAAEQFAKRIDADHGEVTDIVASIGGWWAGGPTWEISQVAWDEYCTGFATAHLAIARARLPRICSEGAYQIIAEVSAIYPVQGSEIVSMQQAALLMQGKVLRAEAGDRRRVFTDVLGGDVCLRFFDEHVQDLDSALDDRVLGHQCRNAQEGVSPHRGARWARHLCGAAWRLTQRPHHRPGHRRRARARLNPGPPGEQVGPHRAARRVRYGQTTRMRTRS